jgi:hypothetical protein
VTETGLARVAAWALDRVPNAAIKNPEVVTGLDQLETYPTAEEAEAQLRADALIGTCRPPLDDEQLVTRESALISLARWVVGPSIDCVALNQLRR